MLNRFTFLVPLALFACAQDKADAPAASTTSASRPASVAETRLRAGGTWSFSLDDSPAVATKIREKCRADATPDACYAKIRAAAALESIRFEQDAKGQLVWLSYDDDGTLLRKVPLRVVSATNDSVVLTPSGPEEGKQEPRLPADAQITVGVRGDGSVTMSDPGKGLLAFRPQR